MKKQIILYIIKTTVEIEAIFLMADLFASSVVKDYSVFWKSFLIWQIPIICIIILSTLSFHVSYSNEIDDLRLQEKINEIKKEIKSNKEFMVCWNEFEKRNGTDMKKYIRTEKGVYEVSEKATYCGKNFYYTTAEVTLEDIDIVKEADTIEELCDGFYIDEGNEFSFYKEQCYEDFEESKKIFFEDFDQTSTLYGFIKTSKGLIYVAKMNENGVLELI